MAERRAAGFNIPLDFYDGPEVNSIPKRIRAAAIGVWALAGDYAATKLTDGYVPADVLDGLGCTDKIRAALKVTINVKGELSPLWVDGRNGGIQLTNWPKHQRTNDEVTTYRSREAERKRVARDAKRNGSTSENEKTSGRTNAGRSTGVRTDVRDPKTETEIEIERGYVQGYPDLGSARAATPGADLVREIIPKGHPAATLTSLRIQASELLNTGTDRETVEAGLRLWVDKPGVGIGRTILASMVSEVLKGRDPHATNGKPVHKLRAAANIAQRLRAEENAAIANQPRREITK
jgi:hypothetical protein